MNRGIHCTSGSSFMGLAVNAGISIWNEECSLHDVYSCIFSSLHVTSFETTLNNNYDHMYSSDPKLGLFRLVFSIFDLSTLLAV